MCKPSAQRWFEVVTWNVELRGSCPPQKNYICLLKVPFFIAVVKLFIASVVFSQLLTCMFNIRRKRNVPFCK